MLLRFIAKNFLSFKEETEFNLFPSSRTTRLNEHKITVNHAKALRMSAIYGANGAGKSNLVKGLALLQKIIFNGVIIDNPILYKNTIFKLNNRTNNEPISFAIEFYREPSIYYYTLSMKDGVVLDEELYISEENEDLLVFKRSTDNGVNHIDFAQEYMATDKDVTFKEILEEKILRPNMLLLNFMAINYPNERLDIANAFKWITENLNIVRPQATVSTIAHLLDKMPRMLNLLNQILPEFKTGLHSITIKKTIIEEEKQQQLSPQWQQMIPMLKSNPGKPCPLEYSLDNRVMASAVYEDGKIYMKEIQPIHKLNNGKLVELNLENESDGTIRIINYIPLIYDVLYNGKTYIVDEIERSLHPILIKEVIKKISSNPSANGQLIFSTHESCLLDQSILRTDEIWFAEKDVEQATQLYPLSDFNVHHTANIENGYLTGRYGGIPFLSNLEDLNWNNHD